MSSPSPTEVAPALLIVRSPSACPRRCATLTTNLRPLYDKAFEWSSNRRSTMAGKRYLPYLIAVLATIAVVAVPSTSHRRQTAKQVAAQAPQDRADQASLEPG